MPYLTLTDILKTELGGRLAGDLETFLDMFADDGILECPFAPEGAMHQLIGKPAIAAYYEKISKVQASAGMELTGSYRSPQGDVFVIEYKGTVQNRRDLTSYPSSVSPWSRRAAVV